MIISNAFICFGQNTNKRYEIALDSITSSLDLDYGAFTVSDTIYDMREIVFTFPKKEMAQFPNDSTKLAEVFSFENMINCGCRPPQKNEFLDSLKRRQDDNAPWVIFFSHFEGNCLLVLAIEETEYMRKHSDTTKHKLNDYTHFNSGFCFWFIFDDSNNVQFYRKQEVIYD